jgi:predicted metalloprotease with PDZ domain
MTNGNRPFTLKTQRATHYRITPLDPHAHLFEVRCTVVDPNRDGQRFRLPAWIPGSYLIREFARHFVTVRAESGGTAIMIEKEAKDLWHAAPCIGPLTVIAEIYAFDLSVRAAYLDAARGYFNGPSVFLCPEDRAEAPCVVEIIAPDGPAFRRWRVATTLPRADAAPWGFGSYRAASYDELIDHPVEMADFSQASFEAGGATHDIAISGRIRADLDRVARDLARICQWQIDFFGDAPDSRAPFDRYLFQIAAVGDGYGGLEHRSSTSLVCKRDDLPAPGIDKITDEYRRFLGLASHEYFHCWNVKRIKPAAFAPYDLGRENYTRQLWAFEGITSYYDDLALVRSGVIEPRSFLELVGRTITDVLRTPGRHVQSVAESSFDAWIKFYRRDENAPNAIISYYAKGSLIALALDLTLRIRRSSLDAVMRTLWRVHGQTGNGVPEDGIEIAATKLAGGDLDSFFARYVRGTEDPPLADLLGSFGVALHLRAAEHDGDRGGKAGSDGIDAETSRRWLGARLAAGTNATLQHVFNGGPAERAGLAAGDVIVAIDGLRAAPDAIEKLLRHRRAGEALTVHAFRRDELIVTELTLGDAPHDVCWLSVDAGVDDETRSRRAAWLGTDAGREPTA